MANTDVSLKSAQPAPRNQSSRLKRLIHGRGILWLVLSVAGLRLVAGLASEIFWFQEVQYLQVFSLRVLTRAGLLVLVFSISASLVLNNLRVANTLAWGRHARALPRSDASTVRPAYPSLSSSFPNRGEQAGIDNAAGVQPVFGTLRLWALLPLCIAIIAAIATLVIYHGQVAFSHWHPQLSLYQVPFPVPLSFEVGVIWRTLLNIQQVPVWLGLLIAFSVVLLIYPLWMLRAIALLMAAGFGVVMAEQWSRVLLYFNATPFDQVDPLFQKDISFYVFQLPLWELMTFWVVGMTTLTLLSCALLYLLSGNSLSQGQFPGFNAPQLRHLYRIGSGVMMAIALHYWLDRYELLYSSQGVTFGASYTDVNVQLWAYTGLSALALVFALVLLGRSLRFPFKGSSIKGPFSTSLGIRNPDRRLSLESALPSGRSKTPQAKFPVLRPTWVMYGLLGFWAIALLSGSVLPALVQRVVVQPNELKLETPFIERTIALTRDALNLDAINSDTFVPETALTFEDLEENALTIDNIRLWDTRPLLETNRQLQRIRLYYEFPDADVDRYIITSDTGESARRQVLISARELEYDDLSDDAKTWVNEHLIYTHGYGFTISPVNTAGPSGLPQYFIRGIEHIPSSEAVRRSIPVGNPRIYYGELTDTYVMTQTLVRELDFPSGSENEYNTYDGSGGIEIGQGWLRLLFSSHLNDWRMLLTSDFTPETRLLYRRNIRERAQAIAPFLRFDSDPYLVVADITQPAPDAANVIARGDDDGATIAESGVGGDRLLNGLTQDPPNYLYWVIDAYTTTNRYPYSDPMDRDFNYIRNSVKVVIDAYNGTTAFFVADESDPLIRSWNKVFPGMFAPLSDMPEALQIHIRYPQDFFQVQSQHLMTYHMTDPQVFYNREDEWRAPSEIYANEQQVVEPYYLTMKLPTGTSEEFILLRPFTPIQRRNMIAWLAARSDGENYGSQLLYTFPKQELIFGPEQIEARINQDPVISQQISLWNREGSRAVQGNLLVIPIEQSLLYVEPLYLEAEQNQLPTLVRVIVVFANKIAMAPTLDEALTAIFGSDTAAEEAPTILRSVDETDLPPLDSRGVFIPNLTEPDTADTLPDVSPAQPIPDTEPPIP